MSTATTTSSIRSEPELRGQTVVLIGGSTGIGLETARRARVEGAKLILTGRNPERLEAHLERSRRFSSSVHTTSSFPRARRPSTTGPHGSGPRKAIVVINCRIVKPVTEIAPVANLRMARNGLEGECVQHPRSRLPGRLARLIRASRDPTAYFRATSSRKRSIASLGPRSSSSYNWRTSISVSAPSPTGLGKRLVHSSASSRDFTWMIV